MKHNFKHLKKKKIVASTQPTSSIKHNYQDLNMPNMSPWADP